MPLTIHWDGKLIEEITKPPILLSGQCVDPPMTVPKGGHGTEEATGVN